jgi:hypothetical protein
MEARIDELLLAQGGVAARWQLLEQVTESRLRVLVGNGLIVVVRHGVYAQAAAVATLSPPERTALEVRAEQLVRRREEVATGLTAALVHGLPVLGRPPTAPRLSLPREQGERPRTERPASWLPDIDVEEVRGVRTTTLARTLVDVARTRPFAFALVTADAALARGCARADAQEVLERCRRWPGSRAAQRVLDVADALAESALESLGRGRMHEQGLPAPELQVDLGDELESVRVDHYWREHRTVAEADGLGKYTTPQVLRAEKLREDRLRDRGEEVVRYVWDEALHRPEVITDRLRRAFARTAARTARAA